MTQQLPEGYSKTELQNRIKLRQDFAMYAPLCLHIRAKSGKISPFKLNKAQLHVHNIAERQLKERGFVRIIVVKGRQQGMSTYIQGRFFHKVTHRRGVRAYILTHEAEATNNLFSMTERFYENAPPFVRPPLAKSNFKELVFDKIDSGYKVGTAGSRGTGRSQTLQYFHASEAAFWPHAEEHAAGVLQAVPKGEAASGTEIWMESTANGIGNYFHDMWVQAERGEGEFEAVFVPWYWEDGYRIKPPANFKIDDDERDYMQLYGLDTAQMCWRRAKIVELGNSLDLFKQEYPATAAEAFRAAADAAFIDSSLIEFARKEEVDPFGAPVLGVDPARFGDDQTAFAFREGRKVHWITGKSKLNLMETVGHVVTLHRQHKFRKIFVDSIGIGAGVVDRLRELGLKDTIVAVNFAEKALDERRYVNKRAECWGEMREWLKDKPVQIPDSDALASELGAVQYKFDSKGRWVLEPKDDLKKRLGKSPDLADALAVTFAETVPVFKSDNSFEPDESLAYYDSGLEPEVI